MSIKRYLFILIGGIVLFIALVQLLLIAYFKQHLNEEIVEKSHQLSTRIVDFAVDSIDLDDEHVFIYADNNQDSDSLKHQQFVKQLERLKHTDDCEVIKSDNKTVEDLTAEAGDQNAITSSVKIDCKNKVEVYNFHTTGKPANGRIIQRVITQEQFDQEKIRWRKRLHQIIEDKHKGDQAVSGFSFIATSQEPEPHSLRKQLLPESHQRSTSIETMVDYMIYLIIASSLGALVLAFWLSNHFTKPLQKLSKGFQALQNGEFGTQVEVSGINEYRKTINSFNQMSARLEQLAQNEKLMQQQGHLAELGEVSRGLAHALRNPMHTIGLSVEQLKDDTLPESLKLKLQDKIQNKIKHIDKTIKALLTLTSGEILRNEDVPIRSVIQDIILEMKANDASTKFNFDYPQQALTLKGAESEIRAIIHTLIVNAVEANDHFGEIEVQLTDSGEFVQITVIDQGNGLDESITDKIFQPHVSTKSEGAGMGLYISKRLANLYYNGDITLSNDESGGCRATALLKKGS